MKLASAATLVIAIAVTVFVSRVKAQPSTKQIDDALRTAVDRGDVPGVVALVTDRKGVVYRGAFGVADDAR